MTGKAQRAAAEAGFPGPSLVLGTIAGTRISGI